MIVMIIVLEGFSNYTQSGPKQKTYSVLGVARTLG